MRPVSSGACKDRRLTAVCSPRDGGNACASPNCSIRLEVAGFLGEYDIIHLIPDRAGGGATFS